MMEGRHVFDKIRQVLARSWTFCSLEITNDDVLKQHFVPKKYKIYKIHLQHIISEN